MKYIFAQLSSKLTISIDTEDGLYNQNITYFSNPSVAIENNKIVMYENGKSSLAIYLHHMGTVNGVLPIDINDAFNKITAFITLIFVATTGGGGATPEQLALKTDKGGYTGSAKDLENAIIAAVTGASGISIVPTSPAPSGTGITSFTATQAGTYTNYGSVVVAANSFAIISRSATGVFSISQTPLDLTSYTKIDDYLKEIYGEYFSKRELFFNKTSGTYSPNSTFKSTDYIPFIQGDTLTATGTAKSTSLNNLTFLTSSKTVISGIDLASNIFTLSVNSANTPSNAAFIIMNANLPDVTKVTINGKNSLSERIDTNVNAVALVSSDSLFYKQRINGYFTEAGYRSLTGVFVPFSSLRSTKLIPFVVGNNLVAVNTVKGGSYANINFYNSSGAHISFISNNSNILTLIVNSANTPINTAFITLNEVLSKPVELRINYLTDLNNISRVLVGHQWNNRRWTSYGDSITAAGSYQGYIVREIACLSTVRGVGSSSVTADFTGVAIQPNGEYIDRQSNYSSNLDFTNALSSAGFTNEVTNPTWLNYSVNPSGFTLPANSYFKISAQASGQERINTLPIDSEAVTVMFGTNDEKNDTYIGNIDDYGDGAGGLTKNFIGSYRLMLKRIKTRCPNAKIIIIIPPKKTSEYNFTNNLRTAEGISFDNFRDAIRLICSTYGHEVIDTTKELNFTNIETLLADGTHPTQSGYKAMGELISRKFSDINLSILT